MKICPKCKKCYSNRFEECSNCLIKLEELEREDISKTVTVKSTETKIPVKNVPKCPTCGSTNIRHITATERGVNAVVFGVFGTKRKCQFECQNPNCKYRW